MSTSARRVECHRCGKPTGLQGGSNVLARHKSAAGFRDYSGACLGSGESPCIVSHSEPCRSELAVAAATPDRDVAAAYILDARRDPNQLPDRGMPPVPESLDDEAGWAAYCAAVKQPTVEQYAEAVLEFCGHPYAIEREDAAQAFRAMARLIWAMRSRYGHGDLHAYGTARRVMSRYAREVRRWDAEARRWAEDQARVLMATGGR